MALSLPDMPAISGSCDSYDLISRANFRTPAREGLGRTEAPAHRRARRSGALPTFAVAAEAVGFDHVLLDLGSHRQEELQHLPHVVTGVVPRLLHALRVLGRTEGLDHLCQHRCGKQVHTQLPHNAKQRSQGTEPPAAPTYPWPAPRSAAPPGPARTPPWGAGGRRPLYSPEHELAPTLIQLMRGPALLCHFTTGGGFPHSGKPSGQILKELKSLQHIPPSAAPHRSRPAPRRG